MASRGQESSLLKIKGTELQQATQELLMEIAAYYQGVLPTDLDPDALGHEFAVDARKAYMYGRARPPFTADPTRFRKILSPSTYSVSSRGITDHEF